MLLELRKIPALTSTPQALQRASIQARESFHILVDRHITMRGNVLQNQLGPQKVRRGKTIVMRLLLDPVGRRPCDTEIFRDEVHVQPWKRGDCMKPGQKLQPLTVRGVVG